MIALAANLGEASFHKGGNRSALKYYAASDIGKVRRVNEDTIYATTGEVGSLSNLFIVADGMGGYNAGAVASQKAVSESIKSIITNNKFNPAEILSDAVSYANARVYSASRTNPKLAEMGTTFVISTIVGRTLYVANVGDSRLYIIRKSIKQVTVDHSLVNSLLDRGIITKDSPEYKSQKNVITRAIGVEPTVDADYFEVALKPGDYVLMCTDGLSNMVSDDDIYEIIRTKSDTEDMVKDLVSLSKKNGGRDNISIIVIDPE